MDTLNHMLHDTRLTEIEADIKADFDQVETGYYDAKLAVMASLMATQGMDLLERIGERDFAAELNERLESVRERFAAKADAMRRHLEENAAIVRAIDSADHDFDDIERQIRSLLGEFDSLLAAKVTERDAKPIGML